MDGKEPIDINDENQLEKVFDDAFAIAQGGERAREIFCERRDACRDRGYHRIERDFDFNNPEDDLRICYDCELWFGQDQAEYVNYRIDPL